MIRWFVDINGERISGDDALARRGLRLTIEEGAYPGGRSYTALLHNLGSDPVTIDRVGTVFPFVKSGRRRRWRVFLDQGSCGWCGVKPLDTLEPDPRLQPIRWQRLSDDAPEPLPFHRSDLQTVVWDAVSGDATLIGFLRQRHGPNKVDIIPNGDASDVDRGEAWQRLGAPLSPGATAGLDPLVVTEGGDPYELLERFATAVMEHQGRRFDAPPIVGMMTWYGYRTAIDEDIVLGNSRIIGELFGGYPQAMQKLMILDHGWQEDANWGYWQPDAKRFPRGMKWLAGKLAQEGLQLGLWYTPFCVTENARNNEALEPLQALGSGGRPRTGEACVWGDLPGHARGLWPLTFLDGANESVQQKWRREFAEMRGWGATYWKIDFFALQAGERTQPPLSIGDLYARTWSNWRKVLGANAHLAPCSCSTNLQLGYNDSIRIAADIGNAGEWPGAMEHYRYGMATVAALWYKHRKFWINDADSIQLAKGCSLGEARVRATMVALSGGHLMLSEDLRGVDNERIEMVRRLIPPYPRAARPLDLFENPFPEGYPRLWSLSLDTGFGPMTALAVFNLTGKTQTYEITPEMLGIASGKQFIALEWWQYKWLGRLRDRFTIDVPPEDVAVIHAQPVGEAPSLVSVSHHITGGYIVEDVSFDEATGKLKGVLATKAGIPMVLFGHLPPGWRLSRKEEFHTMVSSAGGWQSEVVTTGMRTEFEVQFERNRV